MARILLIASVMAVAVETASAQRGISRPSDRSASQLLGRTGGRFTTDTGVSLSRGESRHAIDLPGPDTRGLNLSGSRARVPAALLLGRPGFRLDSGTNHRLFRLPVYDAEAIRSRSGLASTTSVASPMGRSPWPAPRVPAMAFHPPEQTRSEFAEYFDLQPAPPEAETPADRPPPDLSMADLLRRENELIEQQRLEEALATFKKGTTRRAVDRLEHLATAQSMFENLSRLRKDDPLPVLLLLHAALEREQIQVASRALLTLIERDPHIFTRAFDVRPYYGDPPLLEAQMLSRQRLGDGSPSEPMAYALQAYCNMVLGEASRTREALAKMEAANRQKDKDPRIRGIGLAISAAIR